MYTPILWANPYELKHIKEKKEKQSQLFVENQLDENLKEQSSESITIFKKLYKFLDFQIILDFKLS